MIKIVASPSGIVGRRFLVAGRVQRVGFRAFVRRHAVALGLTGHAHNVGDGRVEVVAYGSPEGLSELETCLRRGPALARVDDVLSETISGPADVGFVTK